MNKKWPKLHWSWKISWIELSLSDWTGFFCLGNFHSWALLVVYFNRPNWTLSSLPRRNTAFPKPSADAWNVLRSLCPELPVPMVFPNKLIFLTILGLPQFTFFFPFFFLGRHQQLVWSLQRTEEKATLCSTLSIPTQILINNSYTLTLSCPCISKIYVLIPTNLCVIDILDWLSWMQGEDWAFLESLLYSLSPHSPKLANSLIFWWYWNSTFTFLGLCIIH